METELRDAFLRMKRQEAVAIVKNEIERGTDPLKILRTVRGAMEEVGRRFESGEFFLSELIYSAEVFKGIGTILEPSLKSLRAKENARGAVVFGTPRGDIHDLGKNIVITMMRAQGFDVYDLGIDVPPEKFITEIQKTEAPILAMSALITPTFKAMQEVIALLREKGLRDRTFVIIGGAVTSDLVRKEIGADAQTLDPTEAIRRCKAYVQKRQETG